LRVRVSEPDLVGDLIAYLRERRDAVVEDAGDGEVEVSLLGSYNADRMEAALESRLRDWQSERGVQIDLLP
jgi:hypothetical protein